METDAEEEGGGRAKAAVAEAHTKRLKSPLSYVAAVALNDNWFGPVLTTIAQRKAATAKAGKVSRVNFSKTQFSQCRISN